ncbi:MAG: SAM-dependent chlorinase/fluorinase [Candidatus Aminicenantes bacterium]|nr:SAM-dependent chlorinase/fluorinase [Candidatus Aminicenantes bacterium]
MGKALIALLTDFGTKDFFVASLKGVILSINPAATIVDLTHDLPDFNLRAAAFVLWACYRFFPAGTIFLTVVDPGVGSERRILLARTNRYFFIGPDNGVLSPVLDKEKAEVFEITGKNYFLTDRRTSFEARDKMAPIAAWLSLGVSLSVLAQPVSFYEQLDFPEPQVRNKEVQGNIVYQDKFGNLITNISQQLIVRFLNSNPGANPVLWAGKKKISEMASTYAQGSADKPFFMINSLGLLEIALYQKSAAEVLGLGPGDSVVLKVD